MATLRDFGLEPQATPTTLRESGLVARAAPDVAAIVDQAAANSMGQLRRGFASGRLGSEANALAADMSSLRAAGRNAEADVLSERIQALQGRAATFAPTEQDVTALEWSPSRALDYGLGAVGQGAASMLEPVGVAAGLAAGGRLVGALPHPAAKAAGAGLGLAAPAAAGYLNFRQNKGEFINEAYADPETLRTQTPQQIDTTGNVTGLAAGALDTLLPAAVGRRVAGRAGPAALGGLGLAGKVGLDMAGEAGTELAQGEIKRGALGYLNPLRDTSGDVDARWNDAAGGALGAGPFAVGSQLIASGYNRLGVKDDGEAGDVLRKGASEAPAGPAAPSEGLGESLARGAKGRTKQADVDAWSAALHGDLGDDGDIVGAVTRQHQMLTKELTARAGKGDAKAQELLDALSAPEQQPDSEAAFLDSSVREAAVEHIVGDGADPDTLVKAYEQRKLNRQNAPRRNEQGAKPDADGFVRGSDMVGKILEDRAARTPDAPAAAAAVAKFRETNQRAALTSRVLRDAVPEGSKPQLKRIASELGAEIAQFASDGYAKPTAGDRARVLRIGQQMVNLYGGKKARALMAEVGRTAGAAQAPLYKLLLGSTVAADTSTMAFQQSMRLARAEAADQLAAVVPPNAEAKLRGLGLDLTTEEGRAELLDNVQRFFDGEHERDAKQFTETFGAKAVEAMRLVVGQRIEPRIESEEKIDAKDGADTTTPSESDDAEGDGGLEDGDNWQLDGALKNIDKAPGTKLYGFAGKGMVGSTEGAHPFTADRKTGNLPRLVGKDETFKDGSPALQRMVEKMHEAIGTTAGVATKIKRGAGSTKLTTSNADTTGGTRVRAASAKEVMDGSGVSPRVRVSLLQKYLDKAGVLAKDDPTIRQLLTTDRKIAEMEVSTPKQKIDGGLKENPAHTALRELQGERREVMTKLAAKVGVTVSEDAKLSELADAYFAERFLVVAEQMAEKDQLRLDPAEVKKMIRRGNDDIDYSTKPDIGGTPSEVQADMNLIRFKSNMAVSKDGLAAVRASDLVAWVRKNRNVFDKREVNTPEMLAKDFRNDLMEGIGALAADNFMDGLPYMLGANGDRQSFEDGFPHTLKLGTMDQGTLDRKVQQRRDRVADKLDETVGDDKRARAVAAANMVEKVGPVDPDRVAKDQVEPTGDRNTDPDELLDQGREAKRLIEKPKFPTRPEELLSPQDSARFWDEPRAESADELDRRPRTRTTDDGRVLPVRLPKYPTAPETASTRTDENRVPSETEPRKQTSGVPTDRTELAMRNAVADAALPKADTLTVGNAMHKGERVADGIWGQLSDGRGEALKRMQRLVSALRPEQGLAGGAQYAAPLAMLLTPARVARLVATSKNPEKAKADLALMRSKVADALTKQDDAYSPEFTQLANFERLKLARLLTGNEKLGTATFEAALEKMSWPARMERKAKREAAEAAKLKAKPLSPRPIPLQNDKTEVAGSELPSRADSGLRNTLRLAIGMADAGRKLNEQSTPAGVQAQANAAPTDAAIAEAKAYIAKVLGPKVKTAFSKEFKFAGEWVDAENLIRLSTKVGPGLLTVAHHESMHALWSSLVKNHPAAAQALSNTMSSPQMLARLQALLKGETAALAAITTGPHAAEERVAYAFQFWAAGALDVDRPADTVFAKVRKFLRTVFGMVRESETALDIMTAFHDGKLAEPSAAGRVISGIMKRQTWNEDVKRKFDKQVQYMHAAVAPSNDVLAKSESATARALAVTMFTNPGDEDSGKFTEGYLNARARKVRQYTNRLYAGLQGLSSRDMEDAAKHLQLKSQLDDIAYAPVRDAVKAMRMLTAHYHAYALKAGLKIGFLAENHYPRVWSVNALIEDGGRDKFVAMVLQPKYAKTMEAALLVAQAQPGGSKLTVEDVAGLMHRDLVEKNGVDETGLTGDRGHGDVILSPFFASQKERSFQWLDDADTEPFLEKDLVGAMSRYLHQGVRAAEFARRFGNGGEKLKKLLAMKDDRLDGEVTKDDGPIAAELYAEAAKQGMDEAAAKPWVARRMEDVRIAVAAHEGSLGSDIKPAMRKLSSAAMAYQNLRLLPMSLFAAFGDVMGIVAHGGGAKAGIEAFQQGLKAVYARWKDAASDVPEARQKSVWEGIAEMIGAVDSHMFLEQMGKAHTSEFMTDFARKANRALFMANGLTAWDRSMRVSATKAAVLFLQDQASLPDKVHSRRWLAELGLNAEDIPLDAEGKLIVDRHVLAATQKLSLDEATAKAEKIHYALTRWVEGSVLTPNAAQRPSWASDPHYAVLFHLKQFTYSFHHTILKRAFNEASHGNMNPLGALAAAVPTMVAADMVKGLVVGGGELPNYMKTWDAGDWIMHGASRAGLAGVGQFGIDALSDPVGLFGPTVDQAAKFVTSPTELLGNLHDAVPGLRMVKDVPDFVRV